MGFLGDMRKLLFGVKSVSKTAKNKLEDIVEDKAEDLIDHGKGALKSAKDFVDEKFENLKDKATDTGTDITGKVKSGTEDLLGNATKSAGGVLSKAKDLGGELLDSAKDLTEQAGEKLGDLTESATEKSDKIWDKIIDGSDKVSDKVWNAGDDLARKAKEIGKKIDEKLDETLEDFKRKEAVYEAKEKEMDSDGDGFADKPIDFGGSTLAGTDDFFEKAKRFAEGKPLEGNIAKDVPDQDDDDVLELPGFDDEDGDGDELVDDAHIVDDDE